jgi:hypothetical protein
VRLFIVLLLLGVAVLNAERWLNKNKVPHGLEYYTTPEMLGREHIPEDVLAMLELACKRNALFHIDVDGKEVSFIRPVFRYVSNWLGEDMNNWILNVVKELEYFERFDGGEVKVFTYIPDIDEQMFVARVFTAANKVKWREKWDEGLV